MRQKNENKPPGLVPVEGFTNTRLLISRRAPLDRIQRLMIVVIDIFRRYHGLRIFKRLSSDPRVREKQLRARRSLRRKARLMLRTFMPSFR